MHEVSKETLKLYKEVRAERVNALVRSNLPEFKGLTPEQYERYKADFKYDEYVDVYDTDEEYFDSLKEKFDQYSVEDMDKSAKLYAKLQKLTDVSTDEKANVMRGKLHGLNGRSSKKRVKKVNDMNRYAGEIKQAYAKMSAQSKKDEANSSEQKYNMLRSKFDILELEKMYQYKYIKAFGCKNANERELLTQLEYECQKKKQGILEKLFELNAGTENEALQTARLTEIQTLQRTVSTNVKSAKEAYEKARKKNVVTFKKRIYTDEFEIVERKDADEMIALYQNELSMESVRNGSIQGEEKMDVIREYGKLHYADFADVKADKERKIDSHNVEMIRSVCRQKYPEISEKDLEKYYCISALMKRNLEFDEKGHLTKESEKTDKENADLILSLVSQEKDAEVMAKAFSDYYEKLSHGLKTEKKGNSLSKDNAGANVAIIRDELKLYNMAAAYKKLEALFGTAFTDQIRKLTVTNDGKNIFAEFEKSLADHEESWKTFQTRMGEEGLSVYTENGYAYPETQVGESIRKVPERVAERIAKLSWNGPADQIVIGWLTEAEIAGIKISDRVVLSLLENLKWHAAHQSVLEEYKKELFNIFPEFSSTDIDRLGSLVFKNVYIKEDGTPATSEDEQNDNYNKNMMERLKSGEAEIKKISQEILKRYLDMPLPTPYDDLLDERYNGLEKFALVFSNWESTGAKMGGMDFALKELKEKNPETYKALEEKMGLYAKQTLIREFIYQKNGFDVNNRKINTHKNYMQTWETSYNQLRTVLGKESAEYLAKVEKKRDQERRAAADIKVNELTEELKKVQKEGKDKEKELDLRAEILRYENIIFIEKGSEHYANVGYYRKYLKSMLADKEFTAQPAFLNSRKHKNFAKFQNDLERMHMMHLLKPVRFDETGKVLKDDRVTDEENKKILRAWLNDDIETMAPGLEKLMEQLINCRIDFDQSMTFETNKDNMYDIMIMTEASGLVDNLRKDTMILDWMRKRGLTDEISKDIADLTNTISLIHFCIMYIESNNRGIVIDAGKSKVDINKDKMERYDPKDRDGIDIDSVKEAIQNDNKSDSYVAKLRRKKLSKDNMEYITLDSFIKMANDAKKNSAEKASK